MQASDDTTVRVSYDKTSFMDKTDVSGGIVNDCEGFRKASFIVKHKNPLTLPQVIASDDRSKSNEETKDVINMSSIKIKLVHGDCRDATLTLPYSIKGEEDHSKLE